MLHLIERLLPAPIHRTLLPLAHRIRHRWRKWRKVELIGCAVIITNSAGEMLLLRHSYGPQVWAFPGGGIAKGEDPTDAAIREVKEELGIILPKVQLLGTVEEEISGSPHTAFLFTASTDVPPMPDQREVVDAQFFPPDALPEPLGRVTTARLAFWREQAG